MTKYLIGLGIMLSILLLPIRALATQVISENGTINISTTKVAMLNGSVNQENTVRFLYQMELTKDKPGDRLVIIDSSGGMSVLGEQMIRAIEEERKAGTRVVCAVFNNAHSMAFNLLTHCDIRLATRGSTMIVHKLALLKIVDESGQRPTARALRVWADQLDEWDEPYRRANAKAMRLKLSDYDKFADADTAWTVPTLIKRGYLYDHCTINF